ncbi:MAG TPA: hypothetical protein VGL61_19310 [Kofleriaceae bacterium]
MPDDERTRRRLGDATKARIDDLAAGWSVDSEPPPLPAVPDATPTNAPEAPGRPRTRTQPPPPPGSVERKQLESAILETSDTIDDDAPPRGEVILATKRAPKQTKPPPLPPAVRAKTTSPPPPPPTPPAPPPLVVESSKAVPKGEFDDSVAQKNTVARGKGDATSVATSPFERGDPTTVQQDDETSVQRPSEVRMATVGTLRSTSALRRKRGLVGDVFYVFTALGGVRTARRELADLDDKQRGRQSSRKRYLTTLGRTAGSAERFDHPALGKAREALAGVEDERSKHAGAVAASDAELDRVRRDRESSTKLHAIAVSEATAELVELAKKLEPLEKEAAVARKKAEGLADQLRRIAKKIADTEALLVSVKGEKLDRAAIQSDIATLKADQKVVQRDEPMIAAELDALEPRMAAIRAQQTDAEKRKADAEAAEAEDQRRTTELYEAIGAKRKVVERAAADAEAARDRVLFELGERLYVDRPASFSAQLAPIDQIDLELGDSDRRAMELREILSNVDRMKIARGVAVIVVVLAAVASFVAWVVVMLG